MYAAFRSGKAQRPTTCIVCNLTTTDGATVHAHNEDYHNPWDYVGVCYCCHMAIHRRYTEPATWLAYLNRIQSGWQPPQTQDYRKFIEAFRGSYKHKTPPSNPLALDPWVTALPLEEPDLYTQHAQQTLI